MAKKKEESLAKIKCKKFFRENSFLLGFIGIIIIFALVSFGVGKLKDTNEQKNMESLVYGDDVIEMYYFHWTKCPHCIKQNAFNKDLIQMYPNLKIMEFEITQAGTKEKYEEMAAQFDELPNEWSKFPGTPLTIIGKRINSGFGSAETTGQNLIGMIEEEQKRIDENWNDNTMVRTVDLRAENN